MKEKSQSPVRGHRSPLGLKEVASDLSFKKD